MITPAERTTLGTLLHVEHQHRFRLALPFSERRLLLIVGDIAMLFAAAMLVLLIVRTPAMSFANIAMHHGVWLTLIALVWFMLAVINECYNLTISSRLYQSLLRLLFVGAGTTSIYLLLFFLLGRPIAEESLLASEWFSYKLPRILPILYIGIAFVFVGIWRGSYIVLFTGLQLHRRAMLISSPGYGHDLLQGIQTAAHGYDIVGTFPVHAPASGADHTVATSLHNNVPSICHLMREHKASDIILSVQHGLQPDILETLLACHEKGITIKPIQLVYEELLGRVPVKHLRRDWFPIPPWSATIAPTFYHLSKRMLDIVVALAGLAVLLPLLPFIALAIRIESPGPIFYTQERLGLGGKMFRVIKFRSMIPNAEQAGKAVWASKGDSRITRVGHFLRRTRLDELPQVFNILRGDMSVVGPRPERPQFVEQLQHDIPFYRTRLCVKPGLTGWAQINYRYGNTVEDAVTKLEYDLYYVKRQSLLLDLLIIFRTVSVVLMFKGT